ncbi:MAG: hypothetical protein AAGH40_12815 [Verrucomicrobiota bacterium]
MGCGLEEGAPSVVLSNEQLKVKVYLADAVEGYYTGPRFDWSGMVASVEYGGQVFFGEWKRRDSPNATDNVVGTAGEFGMTAPLGYDDASVGSYFYKIGVGRLQKLNNEPYSFAKNYSVEGLPWKTEVGIKWIRFTQELPVENGWGYVYTQQIHLEEELPVFTITYNLKNTGSKRIRTDHYCHNFVVINGDVPGPDLSLSFNFDVSENDSIKDIAVFEGNKLKFLKELPLGVPLAKDIVFEEDERTIKFAVENSEAAVGLEVAANFDVEMLKFYALGKAVCVEPFFRLNLLPGEEKSWTSTYEFYGVDD